MLRFTVTCTTHKRQARPLEPVLLQQDRTDPRMFTLNDDQLYCPGSEPHTFMFTIYDSDGNFLAYAS